MARCRVCGRPDTPAELLPREVLCAGCDAEFVALRDEVYAEGHEKAGQKVRTTDQAFTEAKSRHQAREMAALDALVTLRRQRVAAGKSAVDGVTPLVDFTDVNGVTVTVAQMKARAQAALDQDAAKAAFAQELEK